MVMKTMVEMTKCYFNCNCLNASLVSLYLSGVKKFPVLFNSLSTNEHEKVLEELWQASQEIDTSMILSLILG